MKQITKALLLALTISTLSPAQDIRIASKAYQLVRQSETYRAKSDWPHQIETSNTLVELWTQATGPNSPTVPHYLLAEAEAYERKGDFENAYTTAGKRSGCADNYAARADLPHWFRSIIPEAPLEGGTDRFRTRSPRPPGGPCHLGHDCRFQRATASHEDEAAVAAVKQWTFEPRQKDGKPVAVVCRAGVNFRLK